MFNRLIVCAAAAMTAAMVLSSPAGAAGRDAVSVTNSNRIEAGATQSYERRAMRLDAGMDDGAARSAYGAFDAYTSDPYYRGWAYDGVNRWGSSSGFNW